MPCIKTGIFNSTENCKFLQKFRLSNIHWKLAGNDGYWTRIWISGSFTSLAKTTIPLWNICSLILCFLKKRSNKYKRIQTSVWDNTIHNRDKALQRVQKPQPRLGSGSYSCRVIMFVTSAGWCRGKENNTVLDGENEKTVWVSLK